MFRGRGKHAGCLRAQLGRIQKKRDVKISTTSNGIAYNFGCLENEITWAKCFLILSVQPMPK